MTPASAAARDVQGSGSWGWAVCGASVTGSLHQRRGQGCDDAYGYGIVDDFVVGVVADGAGSVSGTSAWGAYAACQGVLEHAMWPTFIRDFRSSSSDQYAESQMRWLFDMALERVKNQAVAMDLDLPLLSTTLSVALADRSRAVFGQIGDGVIASEADGRVKTLLIEAKDEYANSTWFIQSEHAFEESFRTATCDAVTAFALSTDGMSYKITDIATGAAYEPFFRGSWQHVRSGASADHLEAMLGGIEDDQTGDDKTVVLAAIRGEGSGSSRATVVSSGAPGALPTRVEGDADPASAQEADAPAARRRRFIGRRRQ